MTIMVEDKFTKERYFLLGAGFGAYKSSRPSLIGGTLFPREDESSIQALAVCKEDGEILFIKSEGLRVIKIDGENLSTKKNELEIVMGDNITDYNTCPACNGSVSPTGIDCSHCELRLR